MPKHNDIKFEDAQEMAKKSPATFYAPSLEELKKIKVGSLVKVCAVDERFWTIIEKIEDDLITAKIDNELKHTEKHGLSCDDIIKFEPRHIYQIWVDN